MFMFYSTADNKSHRPLEFHLCAICTQHYNYYCWSLFPLDIQNLFPASLFLSLMHFSYSRERERERGPNRRLHNGGLEHRPIRFHITNIPLDVWDIFPEMGVKDPSYKSLRQTFPLCMLTSRVGLTLKPQSGSPQILTHTSSEPAGGGVKSKDSQAMSSPCTLGV